ncbi:hypothetical protein AB835_05135 [Candidatus Endobugula sertula]|uniref:Probable chorismate pyruvate-lyase n=1 Tax=Candidatus Endobugula sertula TaxID=62101 RepID=A0A1D2QRE4_9GAMM|nr:hypothetical protein AB835_05135 [Candidatus Endobugula sertula]
MQQNTLGVSQPLWCQPQRSQYKIPHSYYSWLVDKGSLTQKLIDKSQGRLSIEVLQQRIRRANFSEQRALLMPHRHWGVIREVVLYGDGIPWIYARTVIPLTTLHGPLRRLYYLGNKSLGEQLFTDPTMSRGPMEVAQLQPRQLPEKLQISQVTWGRRSVFRVSNKPLLVSEIFLPALLNH